MKNNRINQRGITLIALIITIIVILILAGVGIAMLAGNNSVLNRAGASRVANALGTAKDSVNIAVMAAVQDYYQSIYDGQNVNTTYTATGLDGYITEHVKANNTTNSEYNLDVVDVTFGEWEEKSITLTYNPDGSQVVGTLNNGVMAWETIENAGQKNPVPITSIGEITASSEKVQETKSITLTALINSDATESLVWTSSPEGVVTVASTGKNTAKVTGIEGQKGNTATITASYGTLTPASIMVTVEERTFILGEPAEGTVANYGKKVIDYKSNEETNQDDIGWRLFYQDTEGNTYIIADKLVGSYKPSSSYGSHTGATTSVEGKGLNPLIKSVMTTRSSSACIKAMSWLTDPAEWSMYTDSESNGKASFAIAGPTLELYTKSYNAVASLSDSDSINTIEYPKKGTYGYIYDNSNNKPKVTTLINGIYSKGSTSRWFLASPLGWNDGYVVDLYDTGSQIAGQHVSNSNKIRPIVCIPTIEFNNTYHLEE